MNGVHDMGGMHGMGPVPYEKDEPVFHAMWEARTYGLNRAMAAWGKWNIDAARYEIEQIAPAEYLRMSYYERWLVRLVGLLLKTGLVTEREIVTGKPAPGSSKSVPALTVDKVLETVNRGIPSSRDPRIPPRFQVGQLVQARNMHPAGHTRLPRYARGKRGEIVRDHGVYAFPDTNAHFRGENRQHVYSVRFAARELWGASAPPRDSVFLDMWEEYLEHA